MKKVNMKTCKICVMNESVKEFKLDSNNVCNFCLEWEKNKKIYLNFDAEIEKNNLNKIKNKILKLKKNKYDCVVGLSGGVDSSYVVYLLWKMNLNPIIIHMDNGWNSKTSNSNISKILEKTKFDFKTLILNWNEFKDLQKSFLKANVPDIELTTDHAIFAYIINYALKNKIKYIISGVNFATEHSVIPSWGWRKDDFNHINAIHKTYGTVKLKSYPKMNPFKKIFYEKIIKRIQIINLLDFVNYKTSEAKNILKREFDWENYGSKHHESFFTKFFQGYILPKKFNIDKRILHLSCLIRNNEISREKALDELKMPNLDTQKINEYKNYFKKKLSLSDKEFEDMMSSQPKNHSDYSLDLFNNFIFKNISFILKKIL